MAMIAAIVPTAGGRVSTVRSVFAGVSFTIVPEPPAGDGAPSSSAPRSSSTTNSGGTSTMMRLPM